MSISIHIKDNLFISSSAKLKSNFISNIIKELDLLKIEPTEIELVNLSWTPVVAQAPEQPRSQGSVHT